MVVVVVVGWTVGRGWRLRCEKKTQGRALPRCQMCNKTNRAWPPLFPQDTYIIPPFPEDVVYRGLALQSSGTMLGLKPVACLPSAMSTIFASNNSIIYA